MKTLLSILTGLSALFFLLLAIYYIYEDNMLGVIICCVLYGALLGWASLIIQKTM
jgi:hypothetical protein